ncbi:MAG: YicC family protein [Clostridiales Family XIII bacterium]|nr:YicC family protein [Clostridiales Family XIII bacterium]
MIKSMTGFGRGEASDDVRQVTVEIRSVNHRYGDVTVKLPRRYAFAEEAVKRSVRTGVSRGKTDVMISVLSAAEEDSAIFVNTAVAKQYFKGLRDLQKSLDVSGEISLELLAGMPDVFRPVAGDIDESAELGVIIAAVDAAMVNFNEMRAVEGAELAADMSERADAIERTTYEIEKQSKGLPEVYAERLKTRIKELLGKSGGIDVAEDRIVVEAAMFADKSDVTEEIVRLRSHLEQLREMLGEKADGPAVGKKLDFLIQEMNREANTIGSKANDLGVTRMMLEIKNEVEKIREQVQNIE